MKWDYFLCIDDKYSSLQWAFCKDVKVNGFFYTHWIGCAHSASASTIDIKLQKRIVEAMLDLPSLGVDAIAIAFVETL